MRVLLVQRRLRDERSYLDELRELARVAGYDPVLEIEQIRKPDAKYHIGSGKVREIARIIKDLNIEKVIFYNELKPSQVHNLMKAWKVEVIDRFQLILEIFSKRAGTKEAKLQIELAKLRRDLSFIREQISLMKRGEYPGFLSGGGYKVDAFYDYVNRRIAKIEKELREIRRKKHILRKKRTSCGFPTAVLTGYTGAGKTTIFNRMTGYEGYIDGRPFATLSTKIKRINILGRKILLADTIGFIENLPSLLVEAFYTTLEEIVYADLVILVMDASVKKAEFERKFNASVNILENLGVSLGDVLYVLNKIDLVDSDKLALLQDIIRDRIGKVETVAISALKGIGFAAFERKILSMLRNYLRVTLKLPADNDGIDFLFKRIYPLAYVDFLGFNEGTVNLIIEGTRDSIRRILCEIENRGGVVEAISRGCGIEARA
ncbi:MAG: GTPase HflX [Thermoprotei archaeon]|nr:MAG: GTPase HflX [Thermoprotei archaeon]HDD64324.1 GTPase HflX [Thermoprotei archaeon]